jgi:hypothetical protein
MWMVTGGALHWPQANTRRLSASSHGWHKPLAQRGVRTVQPRVVTAFGSRGCDFQRRILGVRLSSPHWPHPLRRRPYGTRMRQAALYQLSYTSQASSRERGGDGGALLLHT